MRHLAAICVACVLAIAAAAQAPPTQSPPIFRTGVDLVQVDVSVFDKNRRPIRGLTAADFTIREDGNPQKIEAFAAVDVPDVVTSTTEWVKRVSPDVVTNHADNRRLFAIVIDDVTIQPDQAATRQMKVVAHSFVD